MKIEFDVKMTTKKMYDYMMYFTYTGLSFWLAVAMGLLLLASFVVSKHPLYLLAGIAVIVYLPIERYVQAKKQVTLNPVFKENLHYTVTDKYMAIDVKEEHMEAEWSSIVKAVSTKNSIILYTNKVTATIFPKEDLGDQLDAVVKVIKENVPKERMKIK